MAHDPHSQTQCIGSVCVKVPAAGAVSNFEQVIVVPGRVKTQLQRADG